MYTLASITLSEFVPILSILASMLLGFYALLKYVLKESSRNLGADRMERKEFIHAIRELTKSHERVAEAAEKAAREAEQRNGHLAELVIDAKKATLKAIKEIRLRQAVTEQHINRQVVEHETVKTRDTDNVQTNYTI